MTQDIDIRLLCRNTGQIEGLPKNPRFIRDEKFDKLKKSIQENPEMLGLRELLVYPLDGKYIVIGGNMRLEACKALGYKSVPCKVLDAATTVEQLKAYTVKDNAGFGEWDWDALANEWDTEQVADWGLDVPEWDMQQYEQEQEAKDDDFDETKDEIQPIAQKGDIWQLGEHRLMCGDSTSAYDVARLMDRQTADISFSSPPYNAGFGKCITKDNGRSKYITGDDNMTRDEYAQFVCAYLDNAQQHSKYTFCNIQMLANNKLALFDILNANLHTLGEILIWDKTRAQPQLAERVLNSQFEFVFCFHKDGTRAIGTQYFHGTLANIIQISPTRNEYSSEHNAVFPVELPAHFIRNFSTNSVLDLFGGTGTTMIAAEQLGRKCYMMELDPHYCDVIIARWEKLTGQKAVRLTD